MWKPIETVPEEIKNEKKLILVGRIDETHGDEIDVAFWYDHKKYGHWKSSVIKPTHWFKIPSLPS